MVTLRREAACDTMRSGNAVSAPTIRAASAECVVSLSPTSFVVRLPDGQDRFVCCAVDALGIAPMIGQPVEIRSRCHHCGAPLDLTSTPEGPRPEGSDVMLWIGQRADDRCKIADSL